MIPLDLTDPIQLTKREILRRIDELHNVRQWRPLEPNEVMYLENAQNVLRTKMEIEKITGIRE